LIVDLGNLCFSDYFFFGQKFETGLQDKLLLLNYRNSYVIIIST